MEKKINKWNLFLDDVRDLETTHQYMKNSDYLLKEWVIVRNFQEFVEALKSHSELPDLISYDHDLADEHYDVSMYHGVPQYSQVAENFREKTGLDCVRYLIQEYLEPRKIRHPDYLIHSMNPVGKIRINQEIQDWNLRI